MPFEYSFLSRLCTRFSLVVLISLLRSIPVLVSISIPRGLLPKSIVCVSILYEIVTRKDVMRMNLLNKIKIIFTCIGFYRGRNRFLTVFGPSIYKLLGFTRVCMKVISMVVLIRL